MSEILDVEGAANLLGCSVDLVRAMASRGELPGTKIGNRWRFVSSALEADQTTRERVKKWHRTRAERVSEKSTICPAGTVPGLKEVLEELEIEPGEFAFISGLDFELVRKIEDGMWIGAKDRERVLETVVVLRRQKRENEAIEVREAMG